MLIKNNLESRQKITQNIESLTVIDPTSLLRKRCKFVLGTGK